MVSTLLFLILLTGFAAGVVWACRRGYPIGGPRRTALRLGVVGLVSLLEIGTGLILPGPWTEKLPRPLVRALLDRLAAPPIATSRSELPRPNASLKSAPDAWDRLVWQHQAAATFDAWAAQVLANAGPITDAELARLIPLAKQANSLYQETGTLPGSEAWVQDIPKVRLTRERAQLVDDPSRRLRLEWALAELQYPGGGYSHRTDFARVPDAIILQSLAHADARVRLFGVDAVGRRAHEVVMDRSVSPPPGRELVATMATQDPDPAVRALAAHIAEYIEGFGVGLR